MKKTLTILATLFSIAFLTACGEDEVNRVVIGATSVSADVLRQTIPLMAERGFELVVEEFEDFILPNIALQDGDLDMNLFQHRPFLNNWNYNNNGNLVPSFGVFFFPLRVFAGRYDNLNDLREGSVIAIPDDLVNEARALLVLQDLGIITLETGYSLSTTTANILDNPLGVVIQPMAAEILANVLPDVDFAVINGNFANNAGVIHRVIILENGEKAGENPNSIAAVEFTNYVVVRSGDENKPSLLALIESLRHPDIVNFIETEHGDTVEITFMR